MIDLTVIVACLDERCMRQFISANSWVNRQNCVFVLPGTTFSISGCLNNYEVINQSGTGIYDAINTGIFNVKSQYYMVAGSDDSVDYPELINLNRVDAEVITGLVRTEKKLMRPLRRVWLHAHKALTSEHSVGTLFRTQLHERYGLYNTDLSIAADAEFIIRLWKNGVSFEHVEQEFGFYSTHGVSSRRYFKGQLELLQVVRRYAPSIFLVLLIVVLLRSLKRILWK